LLVGFFHFVIPYVPPVRDTYGRQFSWKQKSLSNLGLWLSRDNEALITPMMSRGDLSHIPKSKKDSARCSLSALLFRGNQPRAYKIDYIHSSFFVKDRGESAQRLALPAGGLTITFDLDDTFFVPAFRTSAARFVGRRTM